MDKATVLELVGNPTKTFMTDSRVTEFLCLSLGELVKLVSLLKIYFYWQNMMLKISVKLQYNFQLRKR